LQSQSLFVIGGKMRYRRQDPYKTCPFSGVKMMIGENRPHIRPLEAFPAVAQGGQPVVIFRDPLGIFRETLLLNPQTAHLVALMDGSRTIEDLRMGFFRAFGVLPGMGELDQLVADLESKGLLFGQTFDILAGEKVSAILKTGVRSAAHAGNAYPDSKEALESFLEPFLPGGRFLPDFPDLIVAPHLDLSLAVPAYSAAYDGLPSVEDLTVVLLGVAHQGLSQPLALCPLPFETPLGRTPLNEEAAKLWIEKTGHGEDMDLLAHTAEHSIEFQLLFLQKLFGADSFRILPFLVSLDPSGDLPDDAYFEMIKDFFLQLREETTVRFVAGIDLSHVGPRYGDPEPVSDSFMAEIERGDRDFLRACCEGNRLEMVSFLSEKGEKHRICGAGVLYLLSRIGFERITVKEYHVGWMKEVGSAVSCAALHGFLA